MRADLTVLNELRRGEPARAEPLFREALRGLRPGEARRLAAIRDPGAARRSPLAARKRFAEAEPLIIGGYEGLTARRKDVTADASQQLPEAGQRIVRLYESLGKARGGRPLAEEDPARGRSRWPGPRPRPRRVRQVGPP